jgi:nucleoid-associated protein YgaU
MLGVALLLLPAVFGSPSPSASAPSVDATPRVTAQPTRRQPTPEPMRRYVVRRGDTLRSIAARFLGDASDWPRIYRVNRDRLRSPTELRVGMELRIPPRR